MLVPQSMSLLRTDRMAATRRVGRAEGQRSDRISYAGPCLALGLFSMLLAASAEQPSQPVSPSLSFEQVPQSDLSPQQRRMVSGRFTDGMRWKTGEEVHTVVFSTSRKRKAKLSCGPDCYDAEFYGVHWVTSHRESREVWRIHDFERSCEADLYVGLVPQSFSVTDLDANGIPEVSFLYKLACRSDVSPARLKLMLFEGKSKYAIRGQTKVDDAETGNTPKRDPGWQRLGPSLNEFAMEQWRRFERESAFEQF